jgi:hypothetical protein
MSTRIFAVEAGFGKGSCFTWEEGLEAMTKLTSEYNIICSSDITSKRRPGKGGLYTYMEMMCEIEEKP